MTPSQDRMEALKVWFQGMSDKQKAVILAIGFAVILDLFVLWRFQIVGLHQQWGGVAQLQAQIQKAQTQNRDSSTFSQKLESVHRELADLDKKITTREDLPVVLETISRFARLSGVEISRIKTGAASTGSDRAVSASKTGVKGDPFIRENIEVTAAAGFYSLVRFLTMVEDAPVFLNVKKLDIHTGFDDFTTQEISIIFEAIEKNPLSA